LEKEVVIGEDPRGVYLAGDAVRVLYQLGTGHYMSVIGHGKSAAIHISKSEINHLPAIKAVNFHKTSFLNAAFFKLDLTHDWLEQTVPGGVLQIQPELGW
jgi:hypothetical protein